MIRVHFCPLDKYCREYGAPVRLHIQTSRGNLGIAFTPGSKFVKIRNFEEFQTAGAFDRLKFQHNRDRVQFKSTWFSWLPKGGH